VSFPSARSAGPKRLRVLVVDDSVTQRGVLIALIAADPACEVVGWAASGVEAIRAVARLRPDVVTMDFVMPEMDGVEASRRIMQETPTPIVMVTTSGRDPGLAFKAIEAGALAIVPKPNSLRDEAANQELLRTLKGMAGVRMVRRWAPERLRSTPSVAAPTPSVTTPAPGPRRPVAVVAIGASTGGPQALQEILVRLPADFAPPVLVVQHIAQGFVDSMVEWLRPQCALPIAVATSGRRLDQPGIYVAPNDRHLKVRDRVVELSMEPPVSMHRPSVTVLFQSVARAYGGNVIAVLLSGMGDDGALGISEVKRAGGITIAQDERTSVVFSMPSSAINLGVVDYVQPPVAIPGLLQRLAGCPLSA
jgi:two-component system chemotaxis response regulator CheB